MDRRAFFKGVAAAAASVALEPLPYVLVPPMHCMSAAWQGVWLITDPPYISRLGYESFAEVIAKADRELTKLVLGSKAWEENHPLEEHPSQDLTPT